MNAKLPSYISTVVCTTPLRSLVCNFLGKVVFTFNNGDNSFLLTKANANLEIKYFKGFSN